MRATAFDDVLCSLLYHMRSSDEDSPCYSSGGSERCFHASNLPRVSRKAGSYVASFSLLGRRAPALGMPNGVTPYDQTTPEINTLNLDNTRLQIRWEAHIPDWNATVWCCRHHR